MFAVLNNVLILLNYVADYLFIFLRFMADHDAWIELAEIYVSLQM